MGYDPDEFAARAAALSDPEFARWWSRASYILCITGSSENLINAAFAALTYWSGEPFAGSGSPQMLGIQGAVITVSRRILETHDQCFELTRRLGTLFHSENVGVAFAAIREFDVRFPSTYSMYVIDHLVRVASAPVVPASGIDMSLRGIAFRVLYALDPNFRNFRSLATACEECIIGCRSWGLKGPQVYRDTLQKQLLHYRPR
jgi:hypothetical protein